jgi:RNA-dependent RNA polymerase
LTKVIREDLRRVTNAEWDPDDTQSDDEDYEDEEIQMDRARRYEVFKRAWAAWNVAEEALQEALQDDADAFGAQSFGLIALGVLLEVVKNAQSAEQL